MQFTGNAGDVILAHPLMVRLDMDVFVRRSEASFAIQPHSASKNYKRIPRFITNPPITLVESLNLNRSNMDDYVSSLHSLTPLYVI